ncbi:MAG: HPr(Ser) kinase/phosphatase [Elusimicrobia bacterium]|nr:HPr(Ser) kinase/phosphatase [Elusimicrobiota bacterium]
MPTVDIATLLADKGAELKLEAVAGLEGLAREITVSDINRPGLALAGFLEHLPYERTQIIGISEYTYLCSLSESGQVEALRRIFSHKQAPCCILTRNLEVLPSMIHVFNEFSVPLIRTPLASSQMLGDLVYYLDQKLAPNIKKHGVLCDVYGIGVLILGQAGIGKSECALELVKRGHMLISDDIVEISKRSGRILYGRSLELTRSLIEVRGVGIIDVKSLFGIGSTLDSTRIELVVCLKPWNEVQCERIGAVENYIEILDVKVPEVTIPVGPGRNLAVLIETASLNERLKRTGHSTAKILNEKVIQKIKENSKNK